MESALAHVEAIARRPSGKFEDAACEIGAAPPGHTHNN
jgi:hypothetical protein